MAYMGRPISGKHAIEVAAFVVVFERPFSDRAIDSLLTLKESLQEQYPTFSETKVIKMRVESEGQAQQSSKLSGVSLQKTGEGNKQEWVLRADANTIVCSCFIYERWDTSSLRALSDLAHVIKIVADDTNPVQHMALQVVDRFVGTPEEKYKINKVFNSKSQYLTKHAIKAGALWHVHQGWFEDAGDNRQLNVLNLSTNDTPSGITTTIDHIVRYIFNVHKPVLEAIEMSFLQAIFLELHEKNKEVMLNLLNKRQCRAIKLCPQL